ncbi:hypothetical protein ACH4E7_40335 [Kitasatospora sp. NPDC018058]|uniref:hypothetical protein n=1 Tax=Kitasatospora sp. NPDC018058 TaxID=3364025 RepID=UPI0037C05FB3
MDHFEKELARMMRDTQEHTPFEPRHRERLQAGVRARRRTRATLMTGGSLLLLTGVGVGLPAAFAQDHHTTSPASTTTSTPAPVPTSTPTAIPTSTATAIPTATPTAPQSR